MRVFPGNWNDVKGKGDCCYLGLKGTDLRDEVLQESAECDRMSSRREEILLH